MAKQMFKLNNEMESIEDRYFLTYCLFYALGLLAVTHSHFFITATDYWMYKFRDPNHENYSSENRTGLQAEFTADFSIVSTVSNIAFVILTLQVIRRVLSSVKRVGTSLCGVAAMFALTVIFVELDTDSWQLGFFVLTLIMGFGITAFCAMALVSTIELVTKFPPAYLAAVLSGQSVCGIFSALVQIVSLSIGASSQTTGLIYFLVGLLVVLMTLMYFFYVLKNSDFFIYYVNKKTEVKMQKISRGGLLVVLNKIKYYMISLIAVVGGTIIIHPGVTSLVVSTGKDQGHPWNDNFFVPVVTFLFHNMFDLFGRELAAKVRKPTNVKIILTVAIIRIIFVPLFMFCNAQPRSHLPVIFDHDSAYIIFQIIFSFTHGYLINLCVILTPGATSKEELTLALILLVGFMIVGVGACSFLSTILVKEL